MKESIDPKIYFDTALYHARLAFDQGEVPVGALVLLNDIVIGVGRNQKESRFNPCSHAEIEAIQKAGRTLKTWRLTECTLITTLEPCPMCMGALQQARIKKVIYGAKDEKGGALSLGYHLHDDQRLNYQFEVEYSPQEECSQILTEFFKKKRSEKKDKNSIEASEFLR
ncbi:MAG: tRNA-specific adenosine deaminase [Bdellovibrionaceae bacterium]|nr:tRNA-specific adenosine deaminase [Pseudobdellovibrionaceae bacterium]|tara:strand:- start:906 stop:1409 length:504 start_codon:yes stop_codon:yes gene_type:complete